MRERRFNPNTGKLEKIPMSKKEKEKIVIVWLIFFFPVGLILLIILKPWDYWKYIGMRETSNSWCKILNINPKHILDASGWDKVNLDYSFFEETHHLQKTRNIQIWIQPEFFPCSFE